MKIPVNNISLWVLSIATLVLSGATYAHASETSGTMAAQSSKSHSSITGTLSTAEPATIGEVSTEEVAPVIRASRSGQRRTSTVGSVETVNQSGGGSVLLSDGSLVSTTGLNGTGGGFDPELEEILSGGSDVDGILSPEDVVAYNSSQNPLLSNTDLTASVSDSGMSTGKILTAVTLGLLLLGLSGYAVYTLAGYRRENEL